MVARWQGNVGTPQSWLHFQALGHTCCSHNRLLWSCAPIPPTSRISSCPPLSVLPWTLLIAVRFGCFLLCHVPGWPWRVGSGGERRENGDERRRSSPSLWDHGSQAMLRLHASRLSMIYAVVSARNLGAGGAGWSMLNEEGIVDGNAPTSHYTHPWPCSGCS